MIFAGCGYHLTEEEEKPVISIPFVQGDYEGQLTNELIRAILAGGQYHYSNHGGEYLVQVKVVGDHTDRIGFQYDRKELSGKRLKNLQAIENRRTISAEVVVIDTASGEPIADPIVVSASSDYDYVDINSVRDLAFTTPSGQTESVLNFSIGQLDSVEGAQDDAILAVYRRLAQKIVATVNQALWASQSTK